MSGLIALICLASFFLAALIFSFLYGAYLNNGIAHKLGNFAITVASVIICLLVLAGNVFLLAFLFGVSL